VKIHVLHDSRGRILAAVHVPPDVEGPVPRPVAGRGQKALDVEVPLEFRQRGLVTICKILRVDGKTKKLVPQPAGRRVAEK